MTLFPVIAGSCLKEGEEEESLPTAVKEGNPRPNLCKGFVPEGNLPQTSSNPVLSWILSKKMGKIMEIVPSFIQLIRMLLSLPMS